LIDTFKKEHKILVEVLKTLKQADQSKSERDDTLNDLRKLLAHHTKKEAEYFYKNYTSDSVKPIFDNNFQTVYFQVMDTIDSILESNSSYEGDIDFICNSLESRIIFEEELLSTFGKDCVDNQTR
jgi:hypothetical protein